MTRQLRFIHAADIHLDSPLDQLRQLDATTANRLQLASRRSVELIVQTALDQSVDAVLIAGDLFDGPVKDAGGGALGRKPIQAAQSRRYTRHVDSRQS